MSEPLAQEMCLIGRHRSHAALGLVLLAAASAGAAPRSPGAPERRTQVLARLADGGLHPIASDAAAAASTDADAGAPQVGPLRSGPEPAPALLRRLLERRAPGPVVLPSPSALGDRLIVSVDDDMDAPVELGYEARLDVTGGAAGPTDAVAVRFPSQALARSPPYRVTGVVLGLDDVNGATTWPSVELWREDPVTPLAPRQGALSATTSFDAVAAGLAPAPASTWRPTTFQRLNVPLILDVPDAWLHDGSFDDDFARPDGLLDDGLSDWLECQDGTCRPPLPGDPLLRLSSGAALRSAPGFATLAVKYQASAVASVRPAQDVDLRARVVIRDSSAGFSRAGLAMRTRASDAYYRIEYVKTPPSVEVAAITPFGPDVLGSFGVPPSLGTRTLQVTVTGGSPSVSIDVQLDGAAVGNVVDSTYRYVGGLVGLSASDPASSGEIWDDLVVERRPDVFAVAGLPPGEDVGLPLDVSLDSLRSDSALVSSDGAAFAPRAPGLRCTQPGNPFVQLEVQDSVAGDRLFDREAHVVEVAIACATCPRGVQRCRDDRSFLEASLPSPTAGEPLEVSVGWWNEHLLDDAPLFLADVYTGPCDAPDILVASGSLVAGPDAGQLTGAPAFRRAALMSFTPLDPGEYCVIVQEAHDVNGDCCPDGDETFPLGTCGGTCTPMAPSDSNPATAYAYRDVFVAPACTPRGTDVGHDGPDDRDGDTVPDEINLDGASLRVAKGAGEDVTLSWAVVDPLVFPARYDVLEMEGAPLPAGQCFRIVGPLFDQPSGTTTRTYDLPVRQGSAAWIAVFETDGCAGDSSVADSSDDDVALRGCP